MHEVATFCRRTENFETLPLLVFFLLFVHLLLCRIIKMHAFSRLWGLLSQAAHDVGTHLLLQARQLMPAEQNADHVFLENKKEPNGKPQIAGFVRQCQTSLPAPIWQDRQLSSEPSSDTTAFSIKQISVKPLVTCEKLAVPIPNRKYQSSQTAGHGLELTSSICSAWTGSAAFHLAIDVNIIDASRLTREADTRKISMYKA